MQKKSKTGMRKIGILGGTFNPIHKGHLALGSCAYEQFGLDEVWVMVSKTPPHKSGYEILSAECRSEMVKLAISEEPYASYMRYSDFELRREGYIYTADTLTLLTEQYPEYAFYFIIGGDSLAYLEQWYHPEIIFDKAVILASGRENLQNELLDQRIAYLKGLFPEADIRKILLPDIPYSSTKIREFACRGEAVGEMTGDQVAEYIKTNHLYQQTKFFSN